MTAGEQTCKCCINRHTTAEENSGNRTRHAFLFCVDLQIQRQRRQCVASHAGALMRFVAAEKSHVLSADVIYVSPHKSYDIDILTDWNEIFSISEIHISAIHSCYNSKSVQHYLVS